MRNRLERVTEDLTKDWSRFSLSEKTSFDLGTQKQCSKRVYSRGGDFEQAYAKYQSSGPYIRTTVESSKEILNKHTHARTTHI